MDRSEWIKDQKSKLVAQEDSIYAPIYDEHWGEIDPLHRQFMENFLQLCPSGGTILDAACGTGKYWGMILASGREIFGIDQSQGMLAVANAKFPEVPYKKIGLQEMTFREVFDGAICMDALEMVSPEDWPPVLENLYLAIKPQCYLYFTVEIADEQDIEKAFADGRNAGLPIVFGEWAQEGGYFADWTQDGFYHYYPRIEQVKEWLVSTKFQLVEEAVGDEYHHFLVKK